MQFIVEAQLQDVERACSTSAPEGGPSPGRGDHDEQGTKTTTRTATSSEKRTTTRNSQKLFDAGTTMDLRQQRPHLANQIKPMLISIPMNCKSIVLVEIALQISSA